MIDLERLIYWFEREQRDLPWRNARSPYAVWVSEMMLQQTQVSVVIPYFERWMKRFPSIQHLALAHRDEVIKVWEGLGYYSRARYLHEGAKWILEHHNGVFPSSKEDLAKIKGLGPYTTGAILSFAFNEKAPAVDGNVMRVLARTFLIKDDLSKPASMKKIWQIAESILPDERPWVVNEALIELGATICIKQPKCVQCPIKKNCLAFKHGIAHELPYKSAKTKTEILHRAVAIICWQERFLIYRAQEGEIMSDLHEFPFLETDAKGLSANSFQKKLEIWLGCQLRQEAILNEVTHSFTRYRAFLRPVMFKCISKNPPQIQAHHMWVEKEELAQLAFSSGHRRILTAVNLI